MRKGGSKNKFLSTATVLAFLVSAAPGITEKLTVFNADSPKLCEPFVNALEKACQCKVEIAKKTSKLQDHSIVVGYGRLKSIIGDAFSSPLVLMYSLSPYLFQNSETVNAVVTYPAPEDAVKIIKKLTSRKRVALPYSYGISDEYMRRFRMVMETNGFDVIPILGLNPSGIFVRFKQVAEQVEILFTILDPLVLTPESYSYLARYCRKQKILLIAPTETYLKLGGDLTFIPDYQRIARSTLELKQALQQGEQGLIRYAPVSGCILGKNFNNLDNPQVCQKS